MDNQLEFSEFNELLAKVEANDSEFTQITSSVNNEAKINSLQQLNSFTIALAKNTHLESVDPSFYAALSENKSAELFINFINYICEKNQLKKELNNQENSLTPDTSLLLHLSKSFDVFCLTPIATGAYLLRQALGYTLGFEWLFDLTRPSLPPNGEPDPKVFKVNMVNIFPLWTRDGLKNNIFTISGSNPFRYPRNLSAFFLPLHYALIHLGFLIGAVLGLPFAIAALPIAFIKTGVDTFKGIKKYNENVEPLKIKLLKKNDEIIKAALKLISEENIEHVWDLYQNLILSQSLPKGNSFFHFKTALQELEQNIPLNKTISFVLGKIFINQDQTYLKNFGFQKFVTLPENHPHYAEAMLECGFYCSENKESAQAKEFFEKAAGVQDSRQEEWVRKAKLEKMHDRNHEVIGDYPHSPVRQANFKENQEKNIEENFFSPSKENN